MDNGISNEIRTTYSKSYLIYLSIMMGLSLIFFLLFWSFGEIDVITVLIYVICSIIFLVSLFLTVDTLLSYVSVKGDEITRKVFFKSTTKKMKEITSITRSEGNYNIYIKGKRFCSFSDRDETSCKILYQLEKHGVDISKIEAEVKKRRRNSSY